MRNAFAVALVAGLVVPAVSALATFVTIPSSSRLGPVPTTPCTGAAGQIWTGASHNIAGARALIAAGPSSGAFTAANIRYGDAPAHTPLSTWLGSDAPSLTGLPGSRAASGLTFLITGEIVIPAAGNYEFRVFSDDGMALTIGNRLITSFDGERGYAASTGGATFSAAGRYNLELLYWANAAGNSGLKLEWKRPGTSEFVVVPVGNLCVPTPGAAGALLAGGLFAARRRRAA